jgi:hypothetical protein
MLVGTQGITFQELRKWVQNKAMHGDKAWKQVMSNKEVMIMAHNQASKYSDLGGMMEGRKIVNVADFKAFLLQLFAISLLWTHFKNADSWAEGHDMGNETLNLTEFRWACMFCCKKSDQEVEELYVIVLYFIGLFVFITELTLIYFLSFVFVFYLSDYYLFVIF